MEKVIIKADNLQHIFILNCKNYYIPGEYLKVRIEKIDIENDIFELSAKDFIENPYTIRFNNYPHYLDNVLIKVPEIKEGKKLI